MWRWILRTAIAAAILASATGCATIALVEAATEGQVRENIPLSANAAWQDKDSVLSLCLDGWPAERVRSGEPGRFGFTLSAERLASQRSSKEDIPILKVPPGNISEECPARLLGATDIPIEHVQSGYVTGQSGKGQDWRSRLGPSHEGSRLYSIEGHGPDGTALLVYQSGTPPGLVRLELPPKHLPPEPYLLLGLPFSIAFDAVTMLPVLLFVVLGADMNI